MSAADKDPQGQGNKPYTTGYKKPPVEHRFKVGNKAGKGRPKGSKNLKTLVNDVTNEKVPVKFGGGLKKVSRLEYWFRKLGTKADAADLKAIDMLLRLRAMYEPPEDIAQVSPEQAAYDLETILHHLRMSGLIANEEEGDE